MSHSHLATTLATWHGLAQQRAASHSEVGNKTLSNGLNGAHCPEGHALVFDAVGESTAFNGIARNGASQSVSQALHGFDKARPAQLDKIDGRSLTIGKVVAIARYKVTPELSTEPQLREKVDACVQSLNRKLERGESMYGINTGFGGSADTRTAHVKELQLSLVTGQQIGILPVASPDEGIADSLPISDEPLSQPEAWLATHHADEEHVLASDDSGTLRQDRYCWRTAAQWVGPQLEDLQAATQAVETELNTTTDNPLLDADTDKMYHGGNFQAQAITNAMEKTRLSLALLGKMQFAQTAELVDPAKNRGLPANLSAGDVSLDFGFKAVDIATAAVCSELQALASPVATHVQSAELGNQALNSLALISGRQTVRSIECLSQLFAWSLYMITQAFDLRALQRAHLDVLRDHLKSSLKASFGLWITDTDLNTLVPRIYAKVTLRMDEGAHRPMLERLDEAYRSATQELVQHLATSPSVASGKALQALVDWRESSVHQMEKAYYAQVQQMHEQPYGCHASPLLSPLTRRIYEYIRKDLNVPVMGKQCFWMYQGEGGKLGESMGNQASRIYRAIRNGDLYQLIADVAQKLE
ncbi:phenylalanine ammonia-lyase [Ceraceosorus bombacis]|uniref:Phenylalanine ammonia-lyase n=1 Tax=Ceraceosorus bombacis TaxID=401625 RepID=A0A0P1BH39_9BASI|nr:phenylalanine ammonia-lyase [Ceraceosorus bombacis]